MKLTKKLLALVFTIMLLLSSSVFAQSFEDHYAPTTFALDFFNVRLENFQLIKNYTWKQSAHLKIDNKDIVTILKNYSITAEGEFVFDNVSLEKHKAGSEYSEGDIEENKRYVGQLITTFWDYLFLSKGQFVDFFDDVDLYEYNDSLITVSSPNILQFNDRVTMVIDKNTLLLYKVILEMDVDEERVKSICIYGREKDGANHLVSQTTEVPGRKMAISVKNSEYKKTE